MKATPAAAPHLAEKVHPLLAGYADCATSPHNGWSPLILQLEVLSIWFSGDSGPGWADGAIFDHGSFRSRPGLASGVAALHPGFDRRDLLRISFLAIVPEAYFGTGTVLPTTSCDRRAALH